MDWVWRLRGGWLTVWRQIWWRANPARGVSFFHNSPETFTGPAKGKANSNTAKILLSMMSGMLRYIRTLLEVDDYKLRPPVREEALERVQKGCSRILCF